MLAFIALIIWFAPKFYRAIRRAFSAIFGLQNLFRRQLLSTSKSIGAQAEVENAVVRTSRPPDVKGDRDGRTTRLNLLLLVNRIT